MVGIIDADPEYKLRDNLGGDDFDVHPETHIECEEYRKKVTKGILFEETVTNISFDWEKQNDSPTGYSNPALVLFDSYDNRIHVDKKNIEAFGYTEYGELWFNGHYNVANARNMEVKIEELENAIESNHYEITIFRFDDHLKLITKGQGKKIEAVVALPNSSKYAYVGLTGEYGNINNITIENTEQQVNESDIERIADVISYTNRMESDIPNVQINRNRSAYSEALVINDGMNVVFHTMSLPSANLVWHCPYAVLFSSDDGTVDGPNYREYALLKLNGENECETVYAENTMVKKVTDEFVDWDTWKEKNKIGLECRISFKKKNIHVEMAVEDAGILIRNTTKIKDKPEKVYFTLTGDQCAITDIRIYK
jgi:hypothetical protein